MEEKAWFWPRFRFPAEAERGLADPAIAWCKDKGLPIEKYADTIESGAHAITVLAMTTVPCALPSVYANSAEAEPVWQREGNALLAAIDVRNQLRRVAALAGDAWPT